jgi:hypothetical protein
MPVDLMPVDLMLHPSWTWGSVGPRHFTGNQLRSIEGGFTTARCSTGGVTGAVSPSGVVTHQMTTHDQGVALPPQGHPPRDAPLGNSGVCESVRRGRGRGACVAGASAAGWQRACLAHSRGDWEVSHHS